MKSSLDAFLIGLADLRHYIEGIELESLLLSYPVDRKNPSSCESLVLKYQQHTIEGISKRKRRFDCNSIIVSLYGFTEQFVESLLKAYVNDLSKIISEYDKLPDSITKNHIDFSMELIKHIEEPKYEGLITKKQIISNLCSDFNNHENYRLNVEAFAYHAANFKPNVIDKLFAGVGVDNISGRVIKCPIFTDYLRENAPASVNHITPAEALVNLNDLASRRNEIAHGSPSQLIKNDILLDDIRLLEIYATALYEVVYSEALFYAVKHHGIKLGKPLAIFNNRIIGLSVKNINIKVGDLLVAQQTANKSLPYIAGEIQEIQENKVKSEKILTSAIAKNIGIRVAFKAKENHTFFLIHKQPS